MLFSDFPDGTCFAQDVCGCEFAMHRRTANDACFIALTRIKRCTWDGCHYDNRPIEVPYDEEIAPFYVKQPVGVVVTSPLLLSLEQDVAAFHARPTWTVWKKLRSRHNRYVATHILFPGNHYEVDTIRAVWRAVCEGPFLVVGWTRAGFVDAANALATSGTPIPVMIPDFIGATLVHLDITGNGECCAATLANHELGAMMIEHDELVTWLLPVLASHALVPQ